MELTWSLPKGKAVHAMKLIWSLFLTGMGLFTTNAARKWSVLKVIAFSFVSVEITRTSFPGNQLSKNQPNICDFKTDPFFLLVDIKPSNSLQGQDLGSYMNSLLRNPAERLSATNKYHSTLVFNKSIFHLLNLSSTVKSLTYNVLAFIKTINLSVMWAVCLFW